MARNESTVEGPGSQIASYRLGGSPVVSAPLTSILGRDDDIDRIVALLDTGGVRLLTLTGPGGVGKTRLAQAVLARVEGEYADGGRFVPLASIVAPDHVPRAVARACGVFERSGADAVKVLAQGLATQHRLLVLDNYEHLLADAPTWLVQLLAACPRLQVLVTSRVALHLTGEQRYPVQPLALPVAGADDVVGSTPSVALFIQRARAVRPDLTVNPHTIQAIAEICQHLDGLPLAIELAAARSNVLPPQDLLARLESWPELLTDGPADVPERHRSLHATIAWSYTLLPSDIRQLLRQLSVFSGGFTLAAALEVVDVPGLDTLTGLGALENASLIHLAESNAGSRFQILETIREFAAGKLVQAGEMMAACERHARWCLRLGDMAPDRLNPVEKLDSLGWLHVEYANLRLGLGWFEETGRIADLARLVTKLRWMWYLEYPIFDGFSWHTRLIPHQAELEPDLYGDVIVGLVQLGQAIRDSRTEAWLIEGLAHAEKTGSRVRHAELTFYHAMIPEYSGDHDVAEARFLVTRDRCREAGLAWHRVVAEYHLGIVAYGLGDTRLARSRLEQASEDARAMGDRLVPAWAGIYLAQIACLHGDVATSSRILRELVSETRATFRYRRSILLIVGLMQGAAMGRFETAMLLAGALFTLRQGVPLTEPAFSTCERVMEHAREQLGSEMCLATIERGRRLPEAVVWELLQGLLEGEQNVAGGTSVLAGETAGLTERELEVLRLLADGLTNREIADALYISVRTAGNHVANILSRLELGSRTAAVAWAIRHGLA